MTRFTSRVSVVYLLAHSCDAFSFTKIVTQLTPYGVKSRLVNPSTSPRDPCLFLSNENEDVVPFFATLPDSPESGSKTVTTRLPVGTIFESRDYILTTANNVRGYEWRLKEVDELLDDLTDSAIGFGQVDDSNLSRDYELSQITLVPLDWNQTLYGIGGRFDVYDGQQRLVTLCLIFSALREAFANDSDMEDTVDELTRMINPPKVRKDDIMRLELNKRDNEMFRRILLQEDIPAFTKKQMQSLSATNRRVLDNFGHILSRIFLRSKEDRLKLLDYIIEHVFMLVCIPENESIARNIVMAQGKGMNTEPIDDFKGLLCFRYTTEESDAYKIFDKWDDLAAMPDLEAGSVGRDIISSACLLRASVLLRTKIRKSDQLFALENWLRGRIVEEKCDGTTFFSDYVKPASLLLGRYRLGEFFTMNFLSKSNAHPFLRNSIAVRLEFIRALTTSVTTTKELEMIVLELMLRAASMPGSKPLALKELDDYLLAVERLALWMAIVKPTASQRFQRCFTLLDVINDDNVDDSLSLCLSQEENRNLRESISIIDFGVTAAGRKTANAILRRLNSYIFLKNGREIPNLSSFVEHIVPIVQSKKNWGMAWPDEKERKMFVHRIGNLALVSEKALPRETKMSFGEKKRRFKNEQWPLTQRLLERDEWNKESFRANQGELFYLIDEIWKVN